jgi:hypothetical protein
MTGVILNIINGALKVVNFIIKVMIFLAERVLFTLYRGVGELLESAYKAGHRLIAERLVR